MVGITTHTARGERAPEAHVVVEAINERFGDELGVRASSIPTGDRMFHLKTEDDSIPLEVARFISQSHWEKGSSPYREPPEKSNIFSFVPKSGYHPDK